MVLTFDAGQSATVAASSLQKRISATSLIVTQLMECPDMRDDGLTTCDSQILKF